MIAVHEVRRWEMHLWVCDDDMIDFRATVSGARVRRGIIAGIMQRSCETVNIGGAFLVWFAGPWGDRWATEPK